MDATEDTPGPIAAMLADAAEIAGRPLDKWHPAHCGAIDIRILADGTWLHEGTPIRREPLVRLFASVLRREPDGSHVLVTPGEKLTITVEDAPFVAVAMATEGSGQARRIAFRLNTGEVVIAGPGREITLRDGRPYVHVRAGLMARIGRAVFYELAEIALAEGGSVVSDGAEFPLG